MTRAKTDRIPRRAFGAHLAALAAGLGLAAVPPGTPPAPPLADASEGFADVGWFPPWPEADAAHDRDWGRFDRLLDRLGAKLDRTDQMKLEEAVADLTMSAANATAAHLHEHIVETYRKGGRIVIVVQSLGGTS